MTVIPALMWGGRLTLLMVASILAFRNLLCGNRGIYNLESICLLTVWIDIILSKPIQDNGLYKRLHCIRHIRIDKKAVHIHTFKPPSLHILCIQVRSPLGLPQRLRRLANRGYAPAISAVLFLRSRKVEIPFQTSPKEIL